jgi:hypothetical protein
MISIIGDWVGQLGENGEYWMGRKGSGLIWYLELQGGSPRLSRLRPAFGWDRMNKHLNVMTHTRHMESPNWVVPCAAETEAILPNLTDVKWDSAWATHGVSAETYVWKTCTRVRWALIVSLASSWNCCHSWCPPSLRLSCCQVYTLARWITDSNLRDTLGNYGLFAAPKRRIINFIILGWELYGLMPTV